MTYKELLFTGLFLEHARESHNEYEFMEYGILHPILIGYLESYLDSNYYVMEKGEYECIQEFLKNEVSK